MTDTVDQPTLDDAPVETEVIQGTVEHAEPGGIALRETAQEALAADTAAGVPALWSAAMRLAARIHNTEFVPKAMRGKPAVVLACILYGDELGIGPMRALAQINLIEGKPAASPELMRALVQRAGHKFEIIEKSNEKVTVRGTRADTGAVSEATFTVDDAVQAGLCTLKDGRPYARSKEGHKKPWETYTRSMLMARATSELCRDIFSDVIAGLSYTPEEAAVIEGGVWSPEQVDADTGEIRREAFHEAP